MIRTLKKIQEKFPKMKTAGSPCSAYCMVPEVSVHKSVCLVGVLAHREPSALLSGIILFQRENWGGEEKMQNCVL